MADREILAELVKKAQAGDKASLEKLFSLSYNDIYYFALKTTKNEDLAYDITQEVCIDIFKNISTLQDPNTFVAWSKRITYNRCAMHFRKNHDIITDDSDEEGNIFDTIEDSDKDFIPAEALDQEDFRKTVMGIVNNLPEEQQTAVLLYYFDELSIAEIAKIQGVSEGTVKSRLNYARKAIKAAVEEYEDKNNIKLHSFGMLPFMLWLLKGEKLSLPISATAKETARGALFSSAAATASSTVATTTASAAGKAIIGKIVAITLATSVVLGGGGLAYKVINDKQDNEKSAYSDNKKDFDDEDDDNEKNNHKDDFSLLEEEFSSDELLIFDGLEDKQAEIHHFFSTSALYFVTKTGEIYNVADTSTPLYTQVDPERIYNFYGSTTYVDTNNTLYSEFFDVTKGFADVTGEVVGISSAGLLHSYVFIFTRDSSGILYLSIYSSDSDNSTYISKHPLYASCDGIELGRVKDIEISYSPIYDWPSYEIKTDDALYYCSEGAMEDNEDDRAIFICSQVASDITFINAQPEYNDKTPYFHKNSDESKVCYLNESIFGYSEYSFNLPTDYTASQIEKIIKVNDTHILAIFSDGDVYSINQEQSIKLDTLSAHNRNGKVKDIFVTNEPNEKANFTILLSMTDNRLYYYYAEY